MCKRCCAAGRMKIKLSMPLCWNKNSMLAFLNVFARLSWAPRSHNYGGHIGPSIIKILGVPHGNRTRIAAATERSFTIKLEAPSLLTVHDFNVADFVPFFKKIAKKDIFKTGMIY